MTVPVTVLDGPDAVRAAVGSHLGHSEWLEITGERLARVADATGAALLAATDVGEAVQTLIRITVEVGGSDEPACVIDSLSRWLP